MTADCAAEVHSPERILLGLSRDEKISLLAGLDLWHTTGFPDKGIPSLRVSDGPNGVRGTRIFEGVPSNCFPCATGLAASFDTDLLIDVGKQLGRDCRAKGVHVLLGPTVNIQRSPLGGRGFESFSEDPVLSGKLAGAYISGVQGQGVAATLKHFVGNEQEFNRNSSNSVIDERALREIYLEPFRIATLMSNPRCYMSAYNQVNGVHASESRDLIEKLLRKDWNFEGLVMSDWMGTYSSADSIKAGLDLEMPGPAVWRGAPTVRDLESGKLCMQDIDQRVLHVLKLVEYARNSGVPFGQAEGGVDELESREVLRRAASSSIVLLKNERSLLPIVGATTIGVIGANARSTNISGGGSASLLASYTVSPLAGIRQVADELGIKVNHALGTVTSPERLLPCPDRIMRLSPSAGQLDEAAIGLLEIWLQSPVPRFDLPIPELQAFEPSRSPDYKMGIRSSRGLMADGLPVAIMKGKPYIRITSHLVPDYSGDWTFSLCTAGFGLLYLDGQLLIDNYRNWKRGDLYFGLSSAEQRGTARDLVAGRTYELEVRMWYGGTLPHSKLPIAGTFRLGAFPSVSHDEAIKEALDVAQASDVVILVVGLDDTIETEGHDRSDLSLPVSHDNLVDIVTSKYPEKTIVVNQSGMPVSMPWIKQASTVLQSFYGGNSLGEGLADVLFGKVNPSGRLPVTFPTSLADVPSTPGYGIRTMVPGQAIYNESIYVGYRWFNSEKTKTEPMFPFGHGVSYTSFHWSKLERTCEEAPQKEMAFVFQFHCEVTNIGDLAGAVSTLVYVRPISSTIDRPHRELKHFTKTFLEPGQSTRVTFSLDRDAFKRWDVTGKSWVVDKGEYEVEVGDQQLLLGLEIVDSIRWK